MRTLGNIMERFLSLIILKITLVLYISYLAVKLVADMWVGNIFGLLELLREKNEK
jgi:K+ transporter